MLYGIDVSSYQGKPNWGNIKNGDIEFAILRIADSKGIDASFEHNYMGCTTNGINIGIYRYSYARTVAQARAEAQEVINILKTRNLHMGVWLDLEWDKQRKLGKAAITKIAQEWIRVITDAGYTCGIYCNLDWYRNVLDIKALPVKYWIARYPASDTGKIREALRPNTGEVGWQYSSKGRVPGISGNVDMNLWYEGITQDTAQQPKINPYKEPDYILWRGRLLQSKEYVRWLQWELIQVEDNSLSLDGIFGRATEAALRNAQSNMGIAIDGKCGPVTKKAFRTEKTLG